MTYKPVNTSTSVGFAPWLGGGRRTIWHCVLSCGHYAQITAPYPPLRLDCLACGPVGAQLELPIFLPRQTERRL